jgi:hypothetical protein
VAAVCMRTRGVKQNACKQEHEELSATISNQHDRTAGCHQRAAGGARGARSCNNAFDAFAAAGAGAHERSMRRREDSYRRGDGYVKVAEHETPTSPKLQHYHEWWGTPSGAKSSRSMTPKFNVHAVNSRRVEFSTNQ